MGSLTYTTRPLSDKTWLRPESQRVNSRFGPASHQSREMWWRRTLEALGRELEMLRATDVVLGIDVEERMLRLDGMLRADARPASPAVELAFGSKHGQLLYRCDLFTGTAPAYQHNLRGIVLTLENQRANERYGATAGAQAYAGWRQLEAAPAPTSVSLDQAWAEIRELAGGGTFASDQSALRTAKRRSHPDHGGTSETWLRFCELERVVGR